MAHSLSLIQFYFPLIKSMNCRSSLPKHPVHRNRAVLRPTRISLRFSCSASLQNYSHETSERRSANYQPTVWSYSFLQSLKNDNSDNIYSDDMAREVEEEVRCMMKNENLDFVTILEIIDDIQRLGLGHRFEKDIKGELERISSSQVQTNNLIAQKKSLHATALCFRLLRQHGHEVSQDALGSFLDEDGNVKACLGKDIKGMLSLYEASNLAHEGEYLLDKALAQTSLYLKNLPGNAGSDTAEAVDRAMELPLNRRMILLEARQHIEAYRKRVDANHKLLQLAILEFNMVQTELRRDLQDMSRWWNDLGLANKLSFSRDRLMECFFWSVGIIYEPQFSSCRNGLTKVASFVTTIDDVYDVHGILEELELFTDAVERWDVGAVRKLPDYMKVCFLALFNTVNEMAYDNLKERGEDVIPYLRKAWADLFKAFLQEAKWTNNKIAPSFEDYLENGWRSVSGTVFLIHAYFLMGQNITESALDCLTNYRELMRWPSLIFRLCNDLASSSAEVERGETANAISCYMHDNGVSEEEAREHINKLIDGAWKNINKYKFDHKSTPFAKTFIETAINLARISHCTYQHGDSHGAPDGRSKNRIRSLLIEPIAIMDTN